MNANTPLPMFHTPHWSCPHNVMVQTPSGRAVSAYCLYVKGHSGFCRCNVSTDGEEHAILWDGDRFARREGPVCETCGIADKTRTDDRFTANRRIVVVYWSIKAAGWTCGGKGCAE